MSLTDTWLKKILIFTTEDAAVVVGGIICTLIMSYILYIMIQMITYNKILFKKLKIQGNEIEIFEEANESYFDKYLNEVLYLFENANAEVIVFEDMDRFNSNQIFQKLREINWLINKKSRKNIRFFYLLRDDTFTSKDRTKFFDFIIPVVPVVDGSNSYDQFIGHFEIGGILEEFDKQFLQGLSLYIDDMRILKNIYNEYVIYHNRIQLTELESNKLLAIISYKNIFPRDFSELQLGQGFICNLFSNKSNFITSEIQKLEIEILEKQKLIEAAENELCNEVEELDAIYFTSAQAIEVNGKRENQFTSRASFIVAMKSDPSNVWFLNYNGSRINFDFQSEYNKLSQNTEYTTRKLNIETKSSVKIEKIKDDIIKIYENKIRVEGKKLHEIITKENINEIFSFNYTNEIGEVITYNDIKSSTYFPLIKFLIRNGYIDETYSDYMTYFYEHSLSRIDKIFLRSVTDEVAKEFSYNLKDPALVVSRLRDIDFDREETLNFDLLIHLLESKSQNIIRIINQIKDKGKFEFVSQFLKSTDDREKAEFIKSLNSAWPLVFQGILSSDYFTESQKQQYSLDTLYCSPNEIVSGLNVGNCLALYISSNREFLNVEEPEIPKIISKLRLLNVKFIMIDHDKANPQLFSAVYEANCYEMNMNMISLILSKIYMIPINEEYKHKNYSLIVSKPQEYLVSYVRSNINQYLDNVFENSNFVITDELDAALEIINNPDVIEGRKLTYIKYLQTFIDKIDSITEKEIWADILKLRKIIYSEYNVTQYYFFSGRKLDEMLVEFINSNSLSLRFEKEEVATEFGRTEADEFFKDIIQCNSLTDEKYESLVKLFDVKYEIFNFEGISDSKLNNLIKYNIILMNESNLLFLRENYPDQLEFFISSNIEVYTNDVINEDNFMFSEIVSLLEDEVNDLCMIKLLAYTSDSISIVGKRYSEAVKLHITRYNLDINDLSYLISNYDRSSQNLKTIIITICIEHSDQIIVNGYEVSFNLLLMLLESENLEIEKKRALFILYLPNLIAGQVQKCLQLLMMTDILSLLSGKRPKLKKTNENRKILEVFEEKGWIFGFDTDRNEPEYFRARGRRILTEN
nr:hypothetical protein [Paenibacillus sp. Soil787]